MTEQPLELIVDQAGARLDVTLMRLLADHLPITQLPSRGQVQMWIEEGKVTVNGTAAKSSLKLRGGETLRVTLPEVETDDRVQPETIPLTVIYDDEHLAVIDKPAGLVVHPGDGNETGTLVNALLAHYPQIAEIPYDARRRGIVHRLDKDTSGLIVIAKTGAAQRTLMAQFAGRSVEKTYLALLERAPQTPNGRIEAPIARDPAQRKRMAVMREGRKAISEYKIIDAAFPGGQALAEVKILTGRTHQIRVHMAFIGAPIVGDTIYGFRKQRVALKRHFLHAARLAFDHPLTGERLRFESPLPPELDTLLHTLKHPH
jgi:23S rRNA pseudouridine1911/1915/1917 synthase